MDKDLIEHYQKCKNVYAEMSSDVDYAINDAERPDEYERVLESSAIELLEALKQSLEIIDVLLCQNDRQKQKTN